MIDFKKAFQSVFIFLGVFGAAVFLFSAIPSTPAVHAFYAPESFSELAEAARPGVVNIRTVKTIKGGSPVFRHFFGKPFGGNQILLRNFSDRSMAMANSGISSSAAWVPDLLSTATGLSLPTTM
jgi:S1-C subfamily serine protease